MFCLWYAVRQRMSGMWVHHSCALTRLVSCISVASYADTSMMVMSCISFASYADTSAMAMSCISYVSYGDTIMMTLPGIGGCDQLADDGGAAILLVYGGKEFVDGHAARS